MLLIIFTHHNMVKSNLKKDSAFDSESRV